MLTAVLDELQLDCRLCRIDRGYRSGPDYGILVHHNSEVVAFKKYDRDGFYDGIKIIRTEDIESLRWNGNNLTSRMRFIDNQGLDLEQVAVDCTDFDAFLASAQRHYGCVTCWDDAADRCMVGPLLAHDEGFIKLIDLGNPEKLDRTHTLVAKSRITALEVDGIYERNLLSVHQLPVRPGRDG